MNELAYQLTEPTIIQTMLEIAPNLAQVLALIYLILQLEDRRQLAIRARDESHRYALDKVACLLEKSLQAAERSRSHRKDTTVEE